MTILTVGAGQSFGSLASAIAASQNGDVIDLMAGVYVNDFATITKSITIQGIGGLAQLVATVPPPNGKAILTTDASVTIINVGFSGAAVADQNGAGIRYESGDLTLIGDRFTGNQEGLLAAANSAGHLAIFGSEFGGNGAGDGYSHNLYVNDLAILAIADSYVHDAVGGNEVKSRAETTVITDTRIMDGETQTGGGYDVDLPNGGNATLQGNVIEKGLYEPNGTMVHFGGEAAPYAGSQLTVSGNALVGNNILSAPRAVNNDQGAGPGATATVAGNTIYNVAPGNILAGPGSVGSNTLTTGSPPLDTSSPGPVALVWDTSAASGLAPSLTLSLSTMLIDSETLKLLGSHYVANLGGAAADSATPAIIANGFAGTNLDYVQFIDGRLTFGINDPTAQLYRLYLSAFGRTPDVSGQHAWLQALDGGVSLATVAAAFAGSAEFAARNGTSLSDAGFVAAIYQNALGRAPDPASLSSWLAATETGTSRIQVLTSISESPEHVTDTAPAVRAGLWDLSEAAAEVARLYDTVLGRLPDTGGLAGWVAQFDAGSLNLSQITTGFMASPEFQSRYGAPGNNDFVTQLYANALHRAPDPGGLASWVNALNAGMSRAAVVDGFSESVEHQANTAASVYSSDASQPGLRMAGSSAGQDAPPASSASSEQSGTEVIDMRSQTVAGAGATVEAEQLGLSSNAAYVQFADGRLVFDRADPAAEIFRLYGSALGRTPDDAGEHVWTQALQTGVSLASVAQDFLDSPEFTSQHVGGLTDGAFVTLLYQNALARAPDASGAGQWLAAIGAGTSRAAVLAGISESAEHVGTTSASVRAGIWDIG